MISTVAASSRETQSHSTLPCGVRTSNARCPIANFGVVAMTDQPVFILAIAVEVAADERFERRPVLTARRNVLALVRANRDIRSAAARTA